MCQENQSPSLVPYNLLFLLLHFAAKTQCIKIRIHTCTDTILELWFLLWQMKHFLSSTDICVFVPNLQVFIFWKLFWLNLWANAAFMLGWSSLDCCPILCASVYCSASFVISSRFFSTGSLINIATCNSASHVLRYCSLIMRSWSALYVFAVPESSTHLWRYQLSLAIYWNTLLPAPRVILLMTIWGDVVLALVVAVVLDIWGLDH